MKLRSQRGKQGDRNYCLDHDPKWSTRDRFEPDPGIFGQLTYMRFKCCGVKMARRRVIETRTCIKCGRKEENNFLDSFAVCLCCGNYFNIISGFGYF